MKAPPVPAATSRALRTLPRELSGKRLELLKEAVPKVARVAISTIRPMGPAVLAVRDSPSRGACAGVDDQPWEVRDVDDFERVFAAMVSSARMETTWAGAR